jgi:hypothetical protein
VADDRDRSLRERGQRALQALQYSLRAPKDGGLGAGVAEGRTVVRLPADGLGWKGAGAGNGAEDEGGDCAPRVALPALVARVAAHRRGGAVAGERGRSVRPGKKRERSPVQEQRVEILGGRSRRKVELRPLSRAELARQTKQLIAEAVEPITLRQYESQIQHYRDFCRKRGHFL